MNNVIKKFSLFLIGIVYALPISADERAELKALLSSEQPLTFLDLNSFVRMHPEKTLDLPDGSQILTGLGMNRFYQELPFALYKRKNDVADEVFGNIPPITKAANPFEQKGKAVILVDTRDTYTSAVAQLKNGDLIAAGPYEKNKVIIGKWNAAGQPDNTFGDNGKVIVNLHENAVVPGSELSSPKIIVERNNGDIVVFGSLAQGKIISPFVIVLNGNGAVREKHIIKESNSQSAPDENNRREIRQWQDEEERREKWLEKHALPFMDMEVMPNMISNKQLEEQMNRINP